MTRRRLKNGTAFTIVLLGSIAFGATACWYLLTFLPRLWGWPLSYIGGSSFHGPRHQSIFGMISMIGGGAFGIFLTDQLNRGDKIDGAPMFVILLAAAGLAMGTVRAIELWGGRFASSTWLHASILGLWFAYLLLYRLTLGRDDRKPPA